MLFDFQLNFGKWEKFKFPKKATMCQLTGAKPLDYANKDLNLESNSLLKLRLKWIWDCSCVLTRLKNVINDILFDNQLTSIFGAA